MGCPAGPLWIPLVAGQSAHIQSVLSYEMPHVGLHEQRALASDGNKQLETVLLFELSHKYKSLTRKTNHSFLT